MSLILDKKRIFIVEDNLANSAIEQLLLERNGARTQIERYATDTLAKLKAFAPVDLIIMDLMLPNGVSGFDVAEKIRQEPEFHDVPFVAVSATDAAEALPKARARGFAGYISKPIDFDRFPDQIARLTRGETLWNE